MTTPAPEGLTASPTLQELVERLRTLEKEATPGPWYAHDHTEVAELGDDPDDWIGYAWVGKCHSDETTNRRMDGTVANLDRRRDGSKGYRKKAASDTRLIVDLRNSLPLILRALEALGGAESALEDCASGFLIATGNTLGGKVEKVSYDDVLKEFNRRQGVAVDALAQIKAVRNV